ncbi:hypothetical protein EDD86DRAFT_76513 [Gorgonomyces haynaldii]|nr:hypothetical protein EDD86DRAFT_76513 [Gorgonomyces haynaldii]
MILIVGAGIGGCHLAKRLIDLGYQVQIFERDRVNRHQGLVIGLRQEAVDLLQDFQPNDLFSAESSKNLCMMGNVSCVPLLVVRNVLSVKTSGVKSGLVDRSILRNHMAKQIPVLYDKKLVRYTVGDKITLYFEDGTSYQGDILIGADGANSVVRDQFCPRLKPVEMPLWTNAGSIDIKETTNPLVQASLNALVRKSGKSGCSWLSFCYQSPTGKRMLWSISLPKDLALEYGLHSGLDPHTMRQKTILLAEKEIHPAAQQIVEATLDQDMFRGYDFSSVQTSFYDQPIESDEPVTLLGDCSI